MKPWDPQEHLRKRGGEFREMFGSPDMLGPTVSGDVGRAIGKALSGRGLSQKFLKGMGSTQYLTAPPLVPDSETAPELHRAKTDLDAARRTLAIVKRHAPGETLDRHHSHVAALERHVAALQGDKGPPYGDENPSPEQEAGIRAAIYSEDEGRYERIRKKYPKTLARIEAEQRAKTKGISRNYLP